VIAVDVLYGDHELGQRSITRFALTPRDDRWIASVSRHWNVDLKTSPRRTPPAAQAPLAAFLYSRFQAW
jgi:hypothetical protein